MGPVKIVGIAAVALSASAIVMALRSANVVQPQISRTNQSTNMNELKMPDAEQLKDKLTQGQVETAILAGGCFWGMEEILRKIPGVLETTVGYIGGSVSNPTYQQVCSGRTGHAEGIKVTFDPAKLSYEQLLGYFFRMHDPTTLNQQHNDVGTQYRSAIFYTSEAQKQSAERVKAQVDKSGKFKRPIVTEITTASTFYPGEDYHQKYLVKNPGGYNCHILRD